LRKIYTKVTTTATIVDGTRAAPQEPFGTFQRARTGTLNFDRHSTAVLEATVADGEDAVSTNVIIATLGIRFTTHNPSIVVECGTATADQNDATEVGVSVGTPDGRPGRHQRRVDLQLRAQCHRLGED
jgi:hypothetical protein